MNFSLDINKKSPIFCIQKGDIYVLISKEEAKNLILCSSIIGVTCTKSSSYFAYLHILHNDSSNKIYIEISPNEFEKEFNVIDIGSFLIKYIEKVISAYDKRNIKTMEKYNFLCKNEKQDIDKITNYLFS